jgi:alkylation response protein AidB-like acyl-CoA dehydrogenase
MDLELSDEQLQLQDSVHQFLESECPVSLVRQVVEEEDRKPAEDLWAKMVELDWPAMAVPETEGGIGLGFVELTVVAEQLGMALAPAPFVSTASQFVPAIRASGSARQRRRFLEPVAREGLVGTLAIAEEDGSFDPADIRTEAVPTSATDGNGDGTGGWELHGTKHFVLDGARAQELVVAARVPSASSGTGDEPLGLFLVPQGSVTSRSMDSLDRTRQYSTVALDGAVVTPDRVLGEPGTSTRVLRLVLEEATAAVTAELVGTCQAMFDMVHDYVREREQFGVKIGSFQAIKHKLSDMYVALESARALAYFAALCIAEDDDRRSVAVSMAKASACDCQKLIAQQAIQCLGGIGYTWEHDMHLFVKHAKALASLFGTGAEHRQRVASSLGLTAPVPFAQ